MCVWISACAAMCSQITRKNKRRGEIIASERTERANLVVSMGLELFFLWRALHIPYVSKYAQTKFPTHP